MKAAISIIQLRGTGTEKTCKKKKKITMKFERKLNTECIMFSYATDRNTGEANDSSAFRTLLKDKEI